MDTDFNSKYCRYFGGGICLSLGTLDGKTVIITGANTGIGKETAVELARRNARVIMACRDMQRGQEACSEAKQRSGSENIVLHQLDLAHLESVRNFASRVLDREPHIDILINNAGKRYRRLLSRIAVLISLLDYLFSYLVIWLR